MAVLLRVESDEPAHRRYFPCLIAMDESVRRAMVRWPNVPAVFGWLALDRRGQWRVRLGDADPHAFDRISNAALVAFIGRNYAADAQGRYYFQNGPQRVFVALDHAPWVLRLSDDHAHLVTHTDEPVHSPYGAWLDENGALLIAFERGLGVVLDRDLEVLTEGLRDAAGRPLDGERLIERVSAGDRVAVLLLGASLTMAFVASHEVPRRFGFVRLPAPN